MTEIKPVTYIHSQTLTEVTLPSKENSGGARPRAFRGLANDDDGTCLIGGSIHAFRGRGDPVGRPTTSVVNRAKTGEACLSPTKMQ